MIVTLYKSSLSQAFCANCLLLRHCYQTHSIKALDRLANSEHLKIPPVNFCITYFGAALEYRVEEFSAGNTDLLKNMTCDKNQCANLRPNSSIRRIKKR